MSAVVGCGWQRLDPINIRPGEIPSEVSIRRPRRFSNGRAMCHGRRPTNVATEDRQP